MAASSTCCTLSVSNITLLSARCTGFAKVKGQNDYAFIVDLEWSDYRCMSVKRTYSDFQTFHCNLTKLFPELKHTIKSKLRLQTSKSRIYSSSTISTLDLYCVSLLFSIHDTLFSPRVLPLLGESMENRYQSMRNMYGFSTCILITWFLSHIENVKSLAL